METITYLTEVEPGLVKVGRSKHVMKRMWQVRGHRALWVQENYEKLLLEDFQAAGRVPVKGREYFRIVWEEARALVLAVLQRAARGCGRPVVFREWQRKVGAGVEKRVVCPRPDALSEMESEAFAAIAARMGQSVEDLTVRLIRREVKQAMHEWRGYWGTAESEPVSMFLDGAGSLIFSTSNA